VKVKVRLRKRLGWGLIALAALAVIWSSTQQLPFVIVKPGPAYNVLGEVNGKEVLEIAPAFEDQSTGAIDLLTISEYGMPGETPYLWDLMLAFFSEDSAIYPLEMFYPVGVGPKQMMDEITKDFESSQENSIAAAGTVIDSKVLDSHKVTFGLEQVGGPSGGLAFTLGIIDKLSSGSLTGGKRIAVTGTIDADGTVGSIGGIRQKVFSAVNSGDKFLLIPIDNCEDLSSSHLAKIRVVPVATLSDAMQALKVISSDGERGRLAVCSAY
jgi:PDZ domain-containing protein